LLRTEVSTLRVPTRFARFSPCGAFDVVVPLLSSLGGWARSFGCVAGAA